MQFTMLFSGLQLLVSWFPILGESPGRRNALVQQKSGNGIHCPFIALGAVNGHIEAMQAHFCWISVFLLPEY